MIMLTKSNLYLNEVLIRRLNGRDNWMWKKRAITGIKGCHNRRHCLQENRHFTRNKQKKEESKYRTQWFEYHVFLYLWCIWFENYFREIPNPSRKNNVNNSLTMSCHLTGKNDLYCLFWTTHKAPSIVFPVSITRLPLLSSFVKHIYSGISLSIHVVLFSILLRTELSGIWFPKA